MDYSCKWFLLLLAPPLEDEARFADIASIGFDHVVLISVEIVVVSLVIIATFLQS